MSTSTESLGFRDSKKRSIHAFVINTVHEYFSPLFLTWRSSGLSKKAKFDLYNSRKALAVIQKANCFNQSALIQFTYLMAEKHKDIKEEYRKNSSHTLELENKVRSLVHFMNQDFHRHVFHNFEILHSYFCGRSSDEPRICIKGNFKTHHRDVIVSVFRDSEVSYQSDSDISENTGFSSIAKNGKYFICNSIPKAAAQGLYINPRLQVNKIINESSSKKAKELSRKWREAWKDGDKDLDPKSFYKSTLIVPMTLWNNELSSEFRKKINISDIGRTIFGFLCIDHVDEDYFIEDDVRVGYVFADLLSQYVFHRSVYTDLSETFDDVMKVINSTVDLTAEKVAISLNSECVRKQDDSGFELELKESDDNYLFGLDEKLMDYLGKEKVHIKAIDSD